MIRTNFFQYALTLIRLGFLRVVFSGGGEVQFGLGLNGLGLNAALTMKELKNKLFTNQNESKEKKIFLKIKRPGKLFKR